MNYINRKYYNNSDINEIDFQISVNNYSQALNLVNKYIEEYPNDSLGPMYKARVLALLGHKKEALELASSVNIDALHDNKAKMIAYTCYGNIYDTLGIQVEAIYMYEQAIALEDNNTESYALKARAKLVDIYIHNKEFDRALEVINGTNNKDKDILRIKKAYIYMHLDRLKDAINILNSLKDKKQKAKGQFVYYIYGKCYYGLGDFENASENFKKCLTIKTNIYYRSCYYLGDICYLDNRLEEALNYASQIEEYKEKNEDSSRLLFKIYLKMGYLDKARQVLSNITSDKHQNYHRAMLAYSSRKYKKAIPYTNKMLSVDTGISFENALSIQIEAYLRMGEIDRAEYILNYVEKDLDREFVDLCRSFIAGKRGEDYSPKTKLYSCYQLISYDKEKAIQKVLNRHVADGSTNRLSSEEAVRELFDQVDDITKDKEPVANRFFDKYVIPYTHIGEDNGGNCNTLVILTLPESKEVISLYPLSGADVYDEDKQEQPVQHVKRLSQIDKFNRRYGTK